MNTARLLEFWAPPAGFRLVSVLATTYQLQADFLEDDLLPVALGLRFPAASGRSFRLALEHALQGVDVTIYLHPDGYQPGFRRSPRIDLVTLPQSRLPKLHAKVSLLHFEPEREGPVGEHVVRMIVGSANLTKPGYRDNIEVAIALDDAPGARAEAMTAVRDAASWMRNVVGQHTEQAQSQHRAMGAVFAARPTKQKREEFRFVGLPGSGGLITALKEFGVTGIHTLTAVSPFWPSGNDLSDVVESLMKLVDGKSKRVRLLGPAGRDADGVVHPVMPIKLLAAFLKKNVNVAVAAADPSYGCVAEEPDEGDEYTDLGKPISVPSNSRDLHAKILVLEGATRDLLAIGSFNLTRKGLGLYGQGNTEAGLIWSMPTRQSGRLSSLLAFGSGWREVLNVADAGVIEPEPIEDGDSQAWPFFLHAIRATRDAVIIEGDGGTWPGSVRVCMRDIRSRLVGREEHFDPWVVKRPDAPGEFGSVLPLSSSWLSVDEFPQVADYQALPDLELVMEWEEKRVVLPVIFNDKHLFPVVERTQREDERALIDWFLGLRPDDGAGGDGFSHAIDPISPPVPPEPSDTTDILSYLVRDFVHALPGIRGYVADSKTTENALRAALLGARSPAALAEEVLREWKTPRSGAPRKTAVAAAFQLVELYQVVQHASLPDWPGGNSEISRSQCLARIRAALDSVLRKLPRSALTPALQAYLAPVVGEVHASI